MLSSIAVIAFCTLGATTIPTPKFAVTDLRCENLVEPNCVDNKSPRLAWKTQTTAKNWKQSAYRILVATSESTLKKDLGDIWDTGKVMSSESYNIVFNGSKLASNSQYFWKVQAWDADGNRSAWSLTGKWDMGLLEPADWGTSKWIGNGQQGAAPFVRQTFQSRGGVRRARLFAAAPGYAKLFLNGKAVADRGAIEVEREPGYTNFDKRVLYTAYDVTKLLKTGSNALGAILGTGWYDVHDVATWHFERAAWRGRPRTRMILVLEYRDGISEQVVTEASWKASTGPILTDGIYTGETYDARKEIAGWTQPAYDDLGWASATVLDAPRGKLVANSCPPVVIGQTIKPIAISEPKPGVYIIDFGQTFSGHAELNVIEPAGTKIRMRYSERVDKDGMIERSAIDRFMDKTTPPQPFQTDLYICKGGGAENWEQIFSYSGFRYMEVTGMTKPPTLNNFRGRFAHTDLKDAGSFSCSNSTLNKIQHATHASYLSNAQNIFTDCPQREKNGWTGDAHLACEAGLMNFDSVSLYEKWLNDVADAQADDGRTSVIIPTWGWGAGTPHPAWDSAYPVIVNELYRYTGDDAMVRRHYHRLKVYVDGLASKTENGVIPYDSLGDWLPWKTETPSQVTSTAFLHLDAKILAKFAGILGERGDFAKYDSLAKTTQEAFNKAYFDEKTGLYSNGSQAALSTALYFGLVPEARRQMTFDALVANVEKQGHIDTGIIGAKNVLRVLSEGGRTDVAYKIVARKEMPGWGYWVEGLGATTLFEDWKGEDSLNHIMFGDVSNWFIQWLAGIGLDTNSPGFRHINIQPQPVGDLTWVKATHVSPYGEIGSSWAIEGKSFKLSITIPPNCTATVVLPGGAKTNVGSGKYTFRQSIQR